MMTPLSTSKTETKFSLSIQRGGTDGFQHRAYTFSPDGAIIVSAGNNGYLTSYTVGGKQLGRFVGHTAEVWAVTPSPDGRYLVSGSSDQTVRLSISRRAN